MSKKFEMEPLYKKYKEVLLYLFFGGLTFILSVASYAAFTEYMKFNELIANFFSWILAVLFAYVTNRIWVFRSTAHGMGELLKEMISFFGGRVVTLLIEEVILFVFITMMGMGSLAVKVIAQIVVIVLNYIISKLVVFKDGGAGA